MPAVQHRKQAHVSVLPPARSDPSGQRGLGAGSLRPGRSRRLPLCFPAPKLPARPGNRRGQRRARNGGFARPPPRPRPGAPSQQPSEAMLRRSGLPRCPSQLAAGTRALAGPPRLSFPPPPRPAPSTTLGFCLAFRVGSARRARNSRGLPRRLLRQKFGAPDR